MAYVNVKDWSVDQVTEWLKGLDNVILQYATSFLNNGVTGHQLLNLRADDLEHLGVKTLGHQEIILEAVEHLRNFHFELDKENLQMLALKLSCSSNSLYKELLLVDDDCTVVQTQTMSDVHNIITTIRPLVNWLERSPFAGDKDYMDNKTQLLQLSFEMATSAHRDIFSEKPVRSIKKICEKLAKMADHIIQEISDPMILQPASLDLATLKKKEQEVGFCILPNNHAIHQITDIKYGSPAHVSTKIEEGDEIVQVNYQTVVGWQRKKVLILLQESPPEIVLTLKKRPRHTKVYGQIYMKPYRLPSKKRDGQPFSRWNDGIPSPRLLPIHNLSPIVIPKMQSVTEPPDVEIEMSSSDSEPPDSPLDGSGRMYPLKPRPILQRRNTITGATPTSKRPSPFVEQYWQLWKSQAASVHSSSYNIDSAKFEQDSKFLRDKSASCNLGLDVGPRPATLATTSFRNEFKDKPLNKKRVNFQEKKDNTEKIEIKWNTLSVEHSNLNDEKSLSVNSLASLTNETIDFIDEGRELTDRTNMTVVDDDDDDNIDDANKTNMNSSDSSSMSVIKDSVLADIKIHDIIKKFDVQSKGNEREISKPKIFPRSQIKKPPDVPQKPDINKKPVVPPRSINTKLRGRLDKSHSTPAYDLTEDNPHSDEFQREKMHTDFIDVIPTMENPPTDIEISETKYELGIPVVEAVNIPIVVSTVDEKPVKVKDQPSVDLPPKPPPRTFAVIDFNKPIYPSDSPKPVPLLEQHPKPQSKNVFEFPETHHNSLIESPASLKIYSNDNGRSRTKHYDNKLVTSTPKSKSDYADADGLIVSSKTNTSDNKISPTNSIVRAMIYANKNKTGKKKNTLIAKRRKVNVNDLTPSDIQGYLYQRLRMKHNQNVHWEKRWFVLLGSCLYGFKSKEDSRAACLIFLSGFTVAVANEVKSRLNAFKVYHTGTVFYFSAEDSENLQSWIEMITAATLNNDSLKGVDISQYSETDDDDDNEKLKPNTSDKSSTDSLRKFGSLKKFTSKKHNDAQTGSTSLDRKWFFNKSGSHFKNSLPVPTPHFRSYRKIKASDGSPVSVTTGNFTSHIAMYAPRSGIPRLLQSQNVSVPNLTLDSVSIATNKTKPMDYVHSSNPSLSNINEFHIPSGKQSFKNESLAGFITLEEFMNKQAEEKKNNPHNLDEDVSINFNLIKPDVVYGEIPIRPNNKNDDNGSRKSLSRHPSDSKSTNKQELISSCFGKRLGSIKKNHKDDEFDNRTSTYPKIVKGVEQNPNRSLPRTHKLQEKKYDGHYSSDRNLAVGSIERSYEMIYCPETTTDIQFAQNRHLDDRMYQDGLKRSNKLKKQHSFSEKEKEAFFDPSRHYDKIKLKSAIQYTPMSLPLTQDKKLTFELNLDEKSTKSGKFKQIFGKQNDSKKEKTFLGSPKLHRAIFRKHNAPDISWPSTSPQSVSIPQRDPSPENFPLTPTMAIRPHADYPGLEYPPVFEPETYSLADPQSSLTLLRKQKKK